MDLKLFLRRHHIDSCFIFSLMNYNKLTFNLLVESSLTSFKILQKEIPDCITFPTLQAAFKSKTQTISSREDILKYLQSTKQLKKGITHSAWEAQSYNHLLQTAYPLSLGLPIGLFSRLNQSLRVLPKESTGFLVKSLVDIAKLSYEDRFVNKIERTSSEEFVKVLEEWVVRLNGQDFHGGCSPDKADFLMYSCLESNWIFVKFLLKRFPLLENWKYRMNDCAEQEYTK